MIMDEPQPAPRQLILFCDGTNNTLTDGVKDTNVLQLYEHVDGQRDARQLLYYDPGVGSADALPATTPSDRLSRIWERISGLATGRGIYENIAEAYLFLIRHWQPGDEVWVFGFSRGAFTARAVAGMVNRFGILRPQHENLLPTLLRVYFSRAGDEATRKRRRNLKLTVGLLGMQFKESDVSRREGVSGQLRASFTSAESKDAHVRFIGVWDTVESVGLPGISLQIPAQATIRNKRLDHVRHALSLDEHRWNFLPRPYADDNFGSAAEAQSLQQLWFRGVHSDIGGGYETGERELSNEALRWMVDEAIDCGLRAPPMAPAPARALRHDPVHATPWWTLAGLTLRDSCNAGDDEDGQPAPPVQPVAHPSVQRHTPPAASVWQQWNLLRPLVMVGLLGVVAALAYGWLLVPEDQAGLRSDGPWACLGDAARAAGMMAWAQLQMPWAVPRGNWETIWRQATQGRHPGWAFAADFVLISAYAYVLARFVSRAYTRLAGDRLPGDPRPAWFRLGFALTWMVGADIVENLATLAAICSRGLLWEPLFLLLTGLAAWIKGLGLAGCLALMLLGATKRA